MKVMHIISGGDKGGAKTHMFTLLDELCKIADVTVICLMRGVFYEEILDRNVRTVLLEQKNRMDLSGCRTIEQMVRDESFDIINAHGARANFIAMLLKKRKLHIPIVTTIHSDYLMDFDTPGKKLVFTTLNTLALRKIPYKIAVSDSFRDMLISRGFCPNDILTVYNGIPFDAPLRPVSREAFAERFSIPYDPEKVYVGIAARFNRVKGVDVFLRAAAEVLRRSDKARFVIIGEGEDEAELKALAESLGIAGKVYFLGYVREVYDFYHFIDINTLTSHSESFPYSLLEGARMKKPTVASAVGGIPHLILEDETGLLFESGDYQDCADKLLRLIEDQEEAQRLGRNLYDYAAKRFSSRALAEAYLENYRTFIRKYNRKKRYDVVLSGYYGYQNFGDDIVLKTLIQELKARKPGIEILALTQRPRQMAVRFGVDCQNRFSLRAVRSAFRQSSVYINGGGSLLTDATSKRSLAYYASMLSQAKKSGLTTILLSNGVGPLRSRSSEKIAGQALQCADLITLRDQDSYVLAQQLGCQQEIHLAADLAVLFRPDPIKTRQLRRQCGAMGLEAGKYAVVCLRNWRENVLGFEQIIAAGCDYLAQKYGLTPVLLPVQPDKDRAISHKTLSQMTSHGIVLDRGLDDLDLIYSWIAGARVCISMRLHPLICAFSANTPLLGISYDKKISVFLEEINENHHLDVKNIRTDRLCAALDEVMLAPSPAGQSCRSLDEMAALADHALALTMERFQDI